MTMCNMSIEGGARAGMVAPDDTTFAYMEGSPFAPRGKDFQEAVAYWKSLATDPGAKYDATVTLEAEELRADGYLGHESRHGHAGHEPRSRSVLVSDPVDRKAAESALVYMDLKPGTPMEDIPSIVCSLALHEFAHRRSARGRESDCRKARGEIAEAGAGRSRLACSEAAAEKEGLDKIFRDAGFEWRDAGCSMCIAMNDDVLPSGERSASTSNRNFEGRQGKGSRTHLVSPVMAAAAAIEGHFVDIRKWNGLDGAE